MYRSVDPYHHLHAGRLQTPELDRNIILILPKICSSIPINVVVRENVLRREITRSLELI